MSFLLLHKAEQEPYFGGRERTRRLIVKIAEIQLMEELENGTRLVLKDGTEIIASDLFESLLKEISNAA